MVELDALVVEALLVLETLLLIATLILIYKSREEYRSRLELLENMKIAIEVLSRREYFDSVIELYRVAREWVVATVTGNRPPESERHMIEDLLDLIGERVKEGIEIRLIMPKAPDKLYMGYRYNTIGVKVKYHENIQVYDLRYSVADGRTVVMGFPLEIGEAKPTRRGVKINSEILAGILESNFNSLWDSSDAITYDEYLSMYVNGVLKTHPELTLESLSKQLGIPLEELERVVAR